MKDLKKLQEEYDKYELKSSFVTDAENLEAYLKIAIDTLDAETITILNEIKANYSNFFIALLKTIIFLEFNLEEAKRYQKDNEVLGEIMDFIFDFKNYITKLIKVLNNDNYQEILKFTDFLTDCYNEQITAFERKRAAIELMASGYECIISNDDNREAIDELFNQKYSEYKEEKSLEKIKKIW